MYYEMIHALCPNQEMYSREPLLVCVFDDSISQRVGDDEVYISEFIVAKILGYLKHLKGHPEVTKQFLLRLPHYLNKPKEILMRNDRPKERYIICGDINHRVVLEIKRNGKYTEINTVHLIREENLRKLEGKCIKL